MSVSWEELLLQDHHAQQMGQLFVQGAFLVITPLERAAPRAPARVIMVAVPARYLAQVASS
jgi:hypothetical protein